MNPKDQIDSLSNIDIVVYALYVLGGWQKRVHTEDVALKCYELAPSKFSWIKYPQYPDLSSAYFALKDAGKPRYGALVEGDSERQREKNRIGGWKLTPRGDRWIQSSKERIEGFLGKHAPISDRLHSDRRAKELLGSVAFPKFLKNGEQAEISHAEFAESLVCTVNTGPEILSDRLEQLYSTAEALRNEEIKSYVTFCRRRFVSLLK